MEKAKVADVEYGGKKIILPEGITLDRAIEDLQNRRAFEEEVTQFVEDFDGFIWDAALAFQRAMAEIYGWAKAEVVPGGFFRPEVKPKMISVDIGVNETALVPWGRFSLPGIDGHLDTGAGYKNGRTVLSISVTTRRKHEAKLKELFALTRRMLVEQSIYRGKAFKVRFRDEGGDQLDIPTVKFLDVERIPSDLIFSDTVQRAIETSIFVPIEHSDECRKNKIPLKRGILLAGPYGTGKSLTSGVTAKKAVANRWTYIYVERADELAEAVKMAHQYQPCVVFCEDIDRVVTGERSVEMDDILNIIDGIESKATELMVILTTNHVENINKALLRPGRLDAVINVLPPDATAVEKLIRLYGGKLIPENAHLGKIAETLSGNIPAVIREVTERAKLSAIKLGGSDGKMVLTEAALLDAAETMHDQMALLAKVAPVQSIGDQLAHSLRAVVVNREIGDKVAEMEAQAKKLRNALGMSK